MRRVLSLLLVLAVHAGALAQPLPPTAPERVTKLSTGVATIGTGVSGGSTSNGVFNVSDFGNDPAAAMRRAIHHASTIHFLRGRYEFPSAFTSGRSGLTITADPDAVFVPTGTGSVGLFALTGDNVTVRDLYVLVEDDVDDQTMIKFTDCLAPTVSGLTVEFATDEGSSANPMTGLELELCVGGIVDFNRIYPGEGTRGWLFDRGTGMHFSNSYWGTKTDGGLTTTPSEAWTPRRGWRALEVSGTDYSVFGQGCSFRGVGIVEDEGSNDDAVGDSIVDKMIYIYSSNNGGADVDEEGHSKLTGFICEGVHARNTVHITGQQFFQFTDSQIGAGSGPKQFNLATRFDCAVRIELQGSKANPNFVMNGVMIHNQQWGTQGATSPPQLYLSGVNQGSEVSNCAFNLVQKGPAIIVRHDNSTDVTIKNNVFSTVPVQSPPTDQATMPIQYIATGARLETGNFHHWSGNVAHGFQYGFMHANCLPLGFGGANPIGLSYDSALSISDVNVTLTVKGGGDPTITDPDTSNLFASLATGDVFYLTGPVTAGTATKSNVGLMKIKAKTNDNTITVETNSFFTDFVQTETNVSGCSFFVYPRMTTNLHYVTTGI